MNDQAMHSKIEKPAGGWTIDEYAGLRRVHPVTVKRWIRRGTVEVVRDSKRSVRILGPKR